MENSTEQYIKPTYKILGRFLSECFKFIGGGHGVGQPISDFKVYFQYNRRLIPPYLSAKPWICHRAYLRLKDLIQPEMKVLEFGSGGSTLFLANKVESIFSVEHDKKWFEMIHGQLGSYSHVSHILVEPERKNGDAAYQSIHGYKTESLDFEKYAHAADHLDNESLDLIIIDGRVRPKCLEQAIPKLKPGGILVFDNSNRESYQTTISSALSGWKNELYKGVTVYDAFFTFTTIFFKPKK